MNLLMIFQQSLPEPVLNIVMEMMASDVENAKMTPTSDAEDVLNVE